MHISVDFTLNARNNNNKMGKKNIHTHNSCDCDDKYQMYIRIDADKFNMELYRMETEESEIEIHHIYRYYDTLFEIEN